eukprot:923872-Prymnesium_polylepis.1
MRQPIFSSFLAYRAPNSAEVQVRLIQTFPATTRRQAADALGGILSDLECLSNLQVEAQQQ